ncbi:MAG: PAS domain S-box protein, partial [Patescibacteria group bacterium]
MNWKNLFVKNPNVDAHLRTALLPNHLEQYLAVVKDLKWGFDMVSDHIVITDPNANILYANKAAEQNTGYPVEEMIGKNPGDLWGGQMPQEFYEKMWETIKIQKQPFTGEMKNKRKDGTEYWQEVHISPVLWENGDVKFFIGIEPDITEKKEKEIFRDEFISILAHQLKNPLTSVKWALDWMTKRGGLTQEQQATLSAIYRSNQSLIDLIADLMTVIKIGDIKAKNEEINLTEEIERIIGEVKSRNPDIVFSFDHEGACLIVSNRSVVIQIFSNIITNAAEYSHKGAGKVFICLKKDGDFYVCSVQDNGIGIPIE